MILNYVFMNNWKDIEFCILYNTKITKITNKKW
jgi:hypothetical protein